MNIYRYILASGFFFFITVIAGVKARGELKAIWRETENVAISKRLREVWIFIVVMWVMFIATIAVPILDVVGFLNAK